MKALRTVISAIAILTGAALVVAWCGAWLILAAVDDGVFARTLARTALSTPAVTARIGDEIMSRTADSLQAAGIDVTVIGADDALRTALDDWIRSDDFERTVLAQVDSASERVRDELSNGERPPGPFTVTIDVGPRVNEQLGGVPAVGSDIPNVDVAPVQVEVVSAANFSKARTAYSRLEFAERYFLWIGGALLAVGLAVSTRRRYVVAKFLIAVGVMALVAVAILTLATPDRLAGALPGGADGTWARLAIESFSDSAAPGTRRMIAVIGGASILAGALMAAALKSLHAAHR